MMKKINSTLNIVIGVFVGLFFGYSIFKLYDFKMHPKIYAMQSAPWYTSILIYGAVTVAAVFVILIIKYIIRKKTK